MEGIRYILCFSLCALVFSMIPLVLTSASAQYPSGGNMPQMITGKYANSDYGVSMTFPDGWQTMETKAQTGTNVLSMMPQSGSNQGSSTGTMMMLNMMPKPSGSPPANPNVPTDTSVKCNNISSDSTTINGMSATVIVMQCSGPNVDMKMKSYSFQTAQNLVYTSFIATPSSLYDGNVGTFETAVNTLQITNTVAVPSAPSSAASTPTSPSSNATAQSSTNSATTPEFPTTVGIVMVIITGMVILVTRTRSSFFNFSSTK